MSFKEVLNRKKDQIVSGAMFLSSVTGFVTVVSYGVTLVNEGNEKAVNFLAGALRDGQQPITDSVKNLLNHLGGYVVDFSQNSVTIAKNVVDYTGVNGNEMIQGPQTLYTALHANGLDLATTGWEVAVFGGMMLGIACFVTGFIYKENKDN